jgi:hypothetical protein
MLNMTENEFQEELIKNKEASRKFTTGTVFGGAKYNPANAVDELDSIIESLTKAIEKGDNLKLGIVLGQSLTELKKIRTNLLFA